MIHSTDLPQVGIDDLSVYIPKLYLPIRELAAQRGIDPDKLELGLGLDKMALPDTGEDAVTMASEAVIDLVRKNALDPLSIGRIYVGTESMVDGSKPIASYIVGILNAYFKSLGFGARALSHCDAVDLTFACIGATDALENALDWVRLHPGKKAIIVASDHAKYDLESPGEYTQGAGSVAMLIGADPRLLSIGPTWGVAMASVHDFYKPIRRRVIADDESASTPGINLPLGRAVEAIHSETPVYDGQFSNQCYQERIIEALRHFTGQKLEENSPVSRWSRIVCHLPYAYHARRVFMPIYIDELRRNGGLAAVLNDNGIAEPETPQEKDFIRAVSKTPQYKTFAEERLAKAERASSQVGNIYTGAIYLALASTLETDLSEGQELVGQRIGFFAYGSGAKAKVFEGVVRPGWKEITRRLELFRRLQNRQAVTFEQYTHLHRGTLLQNLDSVERSVHLTHMGFTPTNAFARYYELRES